MLDYPTLSNKPETTIIKDGEATLMKDLTTKSAKLDNIPLSRIVKVNKHYVARPDLVSLALYGTDRYGDIICKMNGLSNPFELNEGMLLVCPSLSDLREVVVSSQAPSELISPKSKVNSNGTSDNIFSDFTTSMISNEKVKYDLMKDGGFKSNNDKATIGVVNETNKKKKNQRRSPAEQTIEDTNYIINKALGLVIY